MSTVLILPKIIKKIFLKIIFPYITGNKIPERVNMATVNNMKCNKCDYHHDLKNCFNLTHCWFLSLSDTIFIHVKMLKLQAVCWCSPAATSLQGKGQRVSGPYSCRSCYTGGSGRTAPCLSHLEHRQVQHIEPLEMISYQTSHIQTFVNIKKQTLPRFPSPKSVPCSVWIWGSV